MRTYTTWKAVVVYFNTFPVEIKNYFIHFPKLAEQYPWEVSIAYVFSRVELAHNMAIHCGTVKIHKVDATLSRKIVENQHITREKFRELFENIYGKPIPKTLSAKIEEAEAVRDKVIHGKTVVLEEQKKAMKDVFEYAKMLNEYVEQIAQLKPFGDLRGYKGRTQTLDVSTSRWILKGLGFTLS